MINYDYIMSQMNFCVQCDTLLDYQGGQTTINVCPNCDHHSEIEGGRKLKSTIYKSSAVATISSATLYDPTLKRTYKLTCVNDDCPSRDPKMWGSRTENGFVVQPDVVIMNYNHVNRVNTYICTICGATFSPDEA